ncbi:MAG: DUF3375 family protein [Spirochaetaceae bacterium]|nr:DUF3375 family protein [Spirochaetaceae bacterium]
MTYEKLAPLFSNHPLFHLFRKQDPAFILSFLYDAFKKRGNLILQQEELVIDLAYALGEETEDSSEKAQSLLNDWCSEGLRLLRRYRGEEGLWHLELTPVAEKALLWLEELTETAPIAAETRFSDILERLEGLVSGIQSDPKARIEELESKKASIEEEIREIEATGVVQGILSDRQVAERMVELVRSSRSLAADFSKVEEDYRLLLTEIYREESDRDSSRSHIVGTALSTSERLDGTPQGQSFRAFWDYLVADYGGDRISDLVDALDENAGVLNGDENLNYLKDLKAKLFASGRKIVETNRRLGERLHRILESHDVLRTRKLLQDILEIKSLAGGLEGEWPEDSFYLEGTGASVMLPAERPLAMPEAGRQTGEIPVLAGDDPGDWSALAETDWIDQGAVEERINRAVEKDGPVSLEDLLRDHPVEKGLPELMAYFRAAADRPKSRIDTTRRWRVDIRDDEKTRTVTLPEVLYG